MTHEPKRWRDLSHGTGTPEQAAARLVASVEAPRIPAAARARVFTRLATSIDRRPSRRPVVWGVAGAVMGALAVLVSLRMSPVIELEAPRGIAALTSASGAVQVAARGGALEDAALGRAIADGEHIVATEGTASLALFGAGDLTLRGGTELVLATEGTSDLVVAELTRGTISVATQLAARARRVVVRAADHRIEASSGARATITHTPPAGLVIDVAEGSVDVTSSKGRTRVDAGRRYDAGEARADRGAHDPIEGAVITQETSARDEVAEPTRAEPEAHAEAEVTEVPPSVRRRAALGLQAARSTERETTAARATKAERDGAEPTRAVPSGRAGAPTRDAAPVHEPTMAELYAMATEARDPVKAIGLFDRVARSSDVRAELSAHQAARLVMRIGRCSEATERFAAMLTRWPASAYAEEARLDVLECQLRLGALDAAHRALEDFLAHHPASARSPEVLFLRAELYRSKGALDHAVADYRAALGSRRDADARYFLGWCALEAARLDAAESALTDYLARYPEGRHAANARGGLAEVTRRRAEKK